MKSIFSLIKHFKYFDNGTKLITKFDFVKILKDFRLNLTIGEIEKIFELFCVNSKDKEQLLNFEEFILILCPPLVDQREKIVNDAWTALEELRKDINVDLIKSVYNAKNHPINPDEIEVLNSFIDSFELFYFSYKEHRNKTVTLKDFEEFYRIYSFLVQDDSQFVSILNNEWGGLLKKEKVEKVEKVEREEREKSVREERTPTRSVKSAIKPVPEKKLENIEHEKPDRSEKAERAEKAEKVEKAKDNDGVSVHSVQKSVHSGIGGKNELKKNLQNIESSNKLTEHKYERSNEANRDRDDLLNKLKKKLRSRGVRGLMNLHKQFILNCENLEKITSYDFINVMNLQRIDLSKKEYESLFNQLRKRNEQVLDFRGFIEQFKKALKDPRLEHVEKAFTKIDVDNRNYLTIENIRLKFNPYKIEKLEANKTEDDLMMDFFDTFELNYNFFVIIII